MSAPHGITLALRRDDHAEVWRIDATRDGETRALCKRALSHSDTLYRATKAAIGGHFWLDDGGAYWLDREDTERAMAAAQEALDAPAPTEGNHRGIACPTCGKVNKNPGEFGLQDEGSVETECGHCGAPYRLLCSISVAYTATPLPAKGGAS